MSAVLHAAAPPALTFDAEKHLYFIGSIHVPNVTSIIKGLTDYSRIPADALEIARQEGVAIHRTVELDCKNDLVVETLPDWLRPYFDAWRKFVAETGFELWESEQRVYHPKFGYAGTLDLVGRMPKIRGKGPAMIDIKRSFYAGAAIGVQLAAYEAARNATIEKELRTDRRFGLQLRKDGTYRLQPYEDREDFSVFLACLTTLIWKEKHNAG